MNTIEMWFFLAVLREDAWHHWLGSDYIHYVLHPALIFKANLARRVSSRRVR